MRERLKIHLAETFGGMVHDTIQYYRNTIPFCEFGIKTWCDLVPEAQAEIIHVGQVRENTIRPYPLPKCPPAPVVVDIEGDHAPGCFREDLDDCVRVCCGAPMEWLDAGIYPRPTMSRFLVYAARNVFETLSEAKEQWLGFIGKPDSRGVRQKMAKAAAGLPAAIAEQQQWHGPAELNHPARSAFHNQMLSCSIALCPMGEGVATARFYEACFYGRCPLVIGKTPVLGDGYTDTSFAIQIDETLSEADMRAALVSAWEMGINEARARGRLAREYFDRTVRPYFADPTYDFIQWWRRRG